MRVHEPITPENLCVALNRGTSLRLAPRDVQLAYHHWRWRAHLPGQRLAFVADTAYARQRLARERQLLQLLADRAHFQVPRLESGGPARPLGRPAQSPGERGSLVCNAPPAPRRGPRHRAADREMPGLDSGQVASRDHLGGGPATGTARTAPGDSPGTHAEASGEGARGGHAEGAGKGGLCAVRRHGDWDQ